jgi:hypothetical protein
MSGVMVAFSLGVRGRYWSSGMVTSPDTG